MAKADLNRIVDDIEKLLTVCLRKVREIRAEISDPELLKKHLRELVAKYLKKVEALIEEL